ncbi:MAG: hypothetical protein JRE23_11115 [Deltaproteobacteria bacterium]|nr:hypothetical protein [Deltaproteobacteria bacterium]
MKPINPFSFDKEASGKGFCNRKKEIKELLGDVRSCHNVIIFSQRRYGKTSLIKKVLDLAKQDGFLTVYVDLYHILSEEDFAIAYAKAFASAMREGSVEKMLQTIKTLFSSLRPKITLDGDGKPEFTFGLERDRDPVRDIEDVLESVKKYTDQKKKKAAVVFDEFQQIGQLAQAQRIEGLMRSHIQTHRNICYVFMGSKKHLILDLFSDPTRPFYESAKMFPLEKIAPQELEAFVYEQFRSTGKQLPKPVAIRLVELCESHPYYVQYVSHSLWEISSDDSTITDQDLDKAMGLTISRTSPRYESIWELLPLRQKQALIALANLAPGEKFFSGAVVQKYALVSAPAFQKALKGLVDKGLVDRDLDRFSIIDVFFKKWIRINFEAR